MTAGLMRVFDERAEKLVWLIRERAGRDPEFRELLLADWRSAVALMGNFSVGDLTLHFTEDDGVRNDFDTPRGSVQIVLEAASFFDTRTEEELERMLAVRMSWLKGIAIA